MCIGIIRSPFINGNDEGEFCQDVWMAKVQLGPPIAWSSVERAQTDLEPQPRDSCPSGCEIGDESPSTGWTLIAARPPQSHPVPQKPLGAEGGPSGEGSQTSRSDAFS